MRVDKRTRLKLSSSNVKSFPSDFFGDDISLSSKNKHSPNISHLDFAVELPQKTMQKRQLRYFDKSKRIWMQDIVKSLHRNFTQNKTRYNTNIESYVKSSVPLTAKHQKAKSLSQKKSKNSELVSKIFYTNRKEAKLKDSFVNPIKSKRMVPDSTKSISTNDTFADAMAGSNKNFRAKAIRKKTLLNRRNLEQISTTRQKVTYSANANNPSVNSFSRLNNEFLEEKSIKPSLNYSDAKLRDYGYMSVSKDRRRQLVRPFNLAPNVSTIDVYDKEARNEFCQEELTLPSIFWKETLSPFENESEPSIFDLNSENTTIASPALKQNKHDMDSNQSSFLLKLENSLITKPSQENDKGVGMTTAYFGNKW